MVLSFMCSQRQHRTLHVQKDVLPCALCYPLPLSPTPQFPSRPKKPQPREAVAFARRRATHCCGGPAKCIAPQVRVCCIWAQDVGLGVEDPKLVPDWAVLYPFVISWHEDRAVVRLPEVDNCQKLVGLIPTSRAAWQNKGWKGRDVLRGTSHQPSERGQIAYFSSLIFTRARWNSASCGENQGDLEKNGLLPL